MSATVPGHRGGNTLQSPLAHDSLADILERVLEKGVVVAGDVTVAIAGVELLTVKIRLLVTTVDKAIDLGLDWWRSDPMLCPAAVPPVSVDDNSNTLTSLEARLTALEEKRERASSVESGPSGTSENKTA